MNKEITINQNDNILKAVYNSNDIKDFDTKNVTRTFIVSIQLDINTEQEIFTLYAGQDQNKADEIFNHLKAILL